MRLAQTQVWPMLRYFETMAPSTAASISASSNTTNGALPPELAPELLHPDRGLLVQNFSDFGRAGEADEAHGGMFAQHLADRRRIAGQDVEHPLRHAGLLGQ